MKFKFSAVFVVALVALAVFTYIRMRPPFEKGAGVPDFTLKSVAGTSVSLSQFKGTPVIVHFWATWCSMCKDEMDLLNAFAADFSDIEVLAISEDNSSAEAVSRFFEGKKLYFNVLLDEKGRVADEYKNYKIPETYFVDRNGSFVYKESGAISWNSVKIREEIAKNFGLPSR